MKGLSIGLATAFVVVSLVPQTLGAQASGDSGWGSIAGFEYVVEATSGAEATGLAIFPAVFSEGRPVEILNPSGVALHLTDAETPGEELVKPAGRLFAPPPGRYRFWLQGDWTMSPYSQLASFGSKPLPGTKVSSMPLVAAGRVTVSSQDAAQASDAQLRLLYAGSDEDHGLHHELSRRRRVSELGDGMLMPEGRVLAALWDPTLMRYVALSRPFEVPGGRIVAAPLRRPGSTEAQLVAYVDRAGGTVPSDLHELVLWVNQDGAEHRADLQILTPWGAYGVWFDLKPGQAVLGGGSDRLYLERVDVDLVGGRIERRQSKLTKRPFPDEQ